MFCYKLLSKVIGGVLEPDAYANLLGSLWGIKRLPFYGHDCFLILLSWNVGNKVLKYGIGPQGVYSSPTKIHKSSNHAKLVKTNA